MRFVLIFKNTSILFFFFFVYVITAAISFLFKKEKKKGNKLVDINFLAVAYPYRYIDFYIHLHPYATAKKRISEHSLLFTRVRTY